MQPSFMSNGTVFQCGSHLVSAAVPGVLYKPDMTIGSLGLSVFSCCWDACLHAVRTDLIANSHEMYIWQSVV